MADRTPIIQLKGIGEKTAKLFAKIGVYTVEDLLTYFPRDYETFQEPTEIAKVPTGNVQAILASVCGNITTKKVRNLTIMNVLLAGVIFIYCFSEKRLKNNVALLCFNTTFFILIIGQYFMALLDEDIYGKYIFQRVSLISYTKKQNNEIKIINKPFASLV